MDPRHREEMIQHGNDGSLPELVRRYEKMHSLYPHLPYFTARLGDLFRYMGAEALAVVHYRKVGLCVGPGINLLSDSLLFKGQGRFVRTR